MPKQTIRARGVDAPNAKDAWNFGSYRNSFYHVFVEADNGYCWGCFGRSKDEAPDAVGICQGTANPEWVMEIASIECGCDRQQYPTGCRLNKTPCAGVAYQVHGICHTVANRLLIPAGIDVRDAPGNEIATFMFGKFGLGLHELAARVTLAAARANEKESGAVSAEDLDNALLLIGATERDEYAIFLEDMLQILNLKVPELAIATQSRIADIHGRLHERRHAAYERFKQDNQESAYQIAIRDNAKAAFGELATEIGTDRFAAVFGMSAGAAAQFSFLQ